MTTPYRSFVLRCWHLGDGRQRFKVECLQTKEVACLPTMSEVVAWIAPRNAEHADPPDAPREPPPREAPPPPGEALRSFLGVSEPVRMS